jgi:hypothetical protein
MQHFCVGIVVRDEARLGYNRRPEWLLELLERSLAHIKVFVKESPNSNLDDLGVLSVLCLVFTCRRQSVQEGLLNANTCCRLRSWL